MGRRWTREQLGRSRVLAVDDARFLVLGGGLELPRTPWHDDPTLPCHAVLLVGQANPEDLAVAIDAMPDPAVPIADFGANIGTRRDFSATVLDTSTLADALARFEPIIRRLVTLPFRADRQDRDDMLIFRLAYSRDRPIEACFDAGTPDIVDYPLIACDRPKRVELEGLAFRDLLRRRHFIRTHACSHCASNSGVSIRGLRCLWQLRSRGRGHRPPLSLWLPGARVRVSCRHTR